MSLVVAIVQITAAFWASIFLFFFAARYYFERKRNAGRSSKAKTTLAFFHPYCNAGGGGEKVLWCGIAALQHRFPHLEIIVYTGDTDATDEEILAKARQRFNVKLTRPIRFVYLKWRRLVEAKIYPVFTLLGQSVGGLLLGAEALCKLCPDIFVESTGFAFPLALFRYLAKCRVVCYVHYPTISLDMLQLVAERRPTYNNRNTVAANRLLTAIKLIYYKIFARIYGWAGSSADAVMVNSTWTYGHIETLWRRNDVDIVYPPCGVDEFLKIVSKSNSEKEIRILTVGQFRPEKDHRMQLEIVKRLKSKLSIDDWTKLKWIFLGGCRGDEDRQLVDQLKRTADEYEIGEKLDFKLNASFDDLKIEYGRALIGVHTMWNEHFGIGVVEHMAAGNIILAHKSGGPKSDIVVSFNGEEVGFLADNPEDYADTIKAIIEMKPDRRNEIRSAARSAVTDRFKDDLFNDGFANAIGSVL